MNPDSFSVRPLDIGLDLRELGVTVTMSRAAHDVMVRFVDREGKRRAVAGAPADVAEVLRGHGYAVELR
jgi:hypothetical protein